MKKTQYLNFSVLMSVYINESAENMKLSLESIFNQTVMPNEIVLIKDGPLTEDLNVLIDQYLQYYPELFNIIKLEKNVGLGPALNIGLDACKNDIIARMDTDDICFSDRFEKQYNYISDHPEISVVGCQIEEFNIIPGDLKRYRKLPIVSSEINAFSKYRNPLNHPAVFFRKNDVLLAGSYKDMPLFEDYFLWVRMLKSGFKIMNIDEPLLNFRTGNDMIGRRNGYSYVVKELNFLKAIREIEFISRWEFMVSVCCKLPIRMLPKNILEFIYKSILR